MIPMSTQGQQDLHPNSLFKILFPEFLLVSCALLYCFLPTFLFGEFPFISSVIPATLKFAVSFSIIQSVIFCHVWKRCKLVQDFGDKGNCEAQQKNDTSVWLRGSTIFVLCWLISHFLCILFGAPLIESVLETTTWAFLLTTIIAVPNLCLLGPNTYEWYRVLVCGNFTNATERFLYFQSLGAILGSWASAIVIPLDWDRDWQVWPIPCVIGCLVGYLVAVFFCCFLTIKELKTTKIH